MLTIAYKDEQTEETHAGLVKMFCIVTLKKVRPIMDIKLIQF